jgi:hypothetical protein
MTSNATQVIESLLKTLTAGNYNVAPDQLVQGSALQIENLESVMNLVTFDDSHIKLQKLFAIKKCRSTLVQFTRQLSYGRFGGSAQREGAVGDVDVGDYIRATVPMCFYSKIARVTIASDMVDTIDGIKAEDREAANSALKIAADIEFDMFKGKADFSNLGVFDGNPLAMPELPNILGCDAQIRQSDYMASTQDLMFAAYGSNQSVVLAQNGALSQGMIEDVSLRVRMNMGKAEALYLDPVILTGYNKNVALGTGVNSLQRIVLAGSAQDASGADLRRQWVSHNSVALEDSRFLSGKTAPHRPTVGSPAAPAINAQPTASGSGAAIPAGTYIYVVTAENERGEGPSTACNAVTVTAGQQVSLTVTAQAGVTHFNIYRGTNAANAKYIGRVRASGNTTFIDLGARMPGFVTAYHLQKDTWGIHELSPYSRMKLGIRDLTKPEAHFRFLTLAGYQPRKNAIIDNLF